MGKKRVSKLDRSVAGKVVLVTGAASGMGRATAFVFADEGAKVAVTDVRGEGAEAVAAEITGAGGEAAAWKLDVADGEEVKRVVDATADRFGGLDILINNAGIALIAPIDAEDYEARWARSIDVLLTAHIRTIRAALPYLRKSSSPRIVNIASTEGLGATARNSPYNAAKTGVIGLTRGLAVELGREGITVNCICPGPIRTGMTEIDPRGAEGRVRAPPHRAAALRRSRGSGADDVVAVAAGGVVLHRRHAAGRRRAHDPAARDQLGATRPLPRQRRPRHSEQEAVERRRMDPQAVALAFAVTVRAASSARRRRRGAGSTPRDRGSRRRPCTASRRAAPPSGPSRSSSRSPATARCDRAATEDRTG